MSQLRHKWFSLPFFVLVALLPAGCSNHHLNVSGDFAGAAINKYQLSKQTENSGYVEFFLAQDFGIFFESLKEGSISKDAINIFWKGDLVGVTHVPQWPWEVDIQNARIGNNTSYLRIPLPQGEQYLEFVVGKFKTGIKLIINPNQMQVVRLESHVTKKNESSRVLGDIVITTQSIEFQPIQVNVSPYILPAPPDPYRIDPYPEAVDALLNMLKSDDWGFRWYAARRLGLIGDIRALEPLKKSLAEERHLDVIDEIKYALDSMGSRKQK